MKQFFRKSLLGMMTVGIAASMVGCADNDLELYQVGEPDWLQEKIDQIAADKANSGEDEEEETGFRVDLNKYKDDFEFNGNAKMIGDILLVDGSGGGKNKNYVTTKEAGWLKDKITLTDVVTISFDARPTVNSSDWNYMFGLGVSGDTWNYIDGTIGFILRMGDPYQAVFPGGAWDAENTCGGSADENPYNYFSGLSEANCNKWYHFDYIYSAKAGLEIYMNGKKQITHPIDGLDAIDAAGIKNVIQGLTEGNLHIGCGIDATLENFGGYIANFIIHDSYYYKKSNFFNGEIPDNQPKSLTVSGAPNAVELGSTDFLKDAVITVNWDNGASDVLKADELSVSTTAPMDEDGKLTTVGTYTVTVSYALTKNGDPAKPVATSYIIEVTAAIQSIKAEAAMETYIYAPGTTEIKTVDLDASSFVKAVKGITGSADIDIPASECQITVESASLKLITVKVAYKNFSTTLSITAQEAERKVNIFEGGETEYTTKGWWVNVLSEDVKVKPYETQVFKFNVISNTGTEVYCCPVIYTLENNDGNWVADNGILRFDGGFWGAGAENIATQSTDWNFDPEGALNEFLEFIIGAEFEATIVNNGDNTADITITGTKNGVSKTTSLKGIKVNSNELYIRVTGEDGQLTIKMH